MSTALLGALLLAVSLVSVAVYMSSLGQLLIGEKRPGLVRTAVCRLFAALLYVGVGLATLQSGQQGPLLGLGVFTVVQLMWQVNSIADVLLTRKARKEKMSEPTPDPLGVTDPVANYATPLPDTVVSAEIDMLSDKLGKLTRKVETITEKEADSAYWRRFERAALAFVSVVAVSALIFGLVIYNRADRANELARQNSILIAEMRDTQARINAQQARQDVTVHEFCGLYESFLSFYSPRGRATFPQGPDAYDFEFHRLLVSSNHLQCGLKPPRGLDG